MTYAFPREPSIEAGETLELCVSNERPCTVQFVRCGAIDETMREHAGSVIPAQSAPAGSAAHPWAWPIHRFEVPSNWRSGVYAALLGAVPGDPLDARTARALFIVKARPPRAPIAYNVPLFTFHAYNVAIDQTGERTCLYNHAPAVTLARPGGGIGGHTWDEGIVDVYDAATPRQTYAHWDQPAIRWLERHVGAVDYLCDLDLHRDPCALQGSELLIAFGHHEYWSDAMRNALTAHLQRGANAAFFTGNTAYFRIRYDEATRAISRIGKWEEWPEDRTFGVSYRFGGGKWRGARPPSGLSVGRPRHWAFEGCGFEAGDGFGRQQRLIGYEFDGTPSQPHANFETLAEARVTWDVGDGSGELAPGAHASLGIMHQRGLCFVAGTVDWPRLLRDRDDTVARITANIIRRLAPSAGLKGAG